MVAASYLQLNTHDSAYSNVVAAVAEVNKIHRLLRHWMRPAVKAKSFIGEVDYLPAFNIC